MRGYSRVIVYVPGFMYGDTKLPLESVLALEEEGGSAQSGILRQDIRV